MQIAVHAPHTIVGQLEENACDLAIVGEGETILPPSIGKMKIGEDRLTLIASPEHPLVKKQKLTLADAAGENFILPGSRDASLQSFRAFLKKLGIRSVEMNDAEAVKRAVASGSGLAVVSRSAVLHELEEGSLAELKAEESG
jgi:DNA-binding transcriptional LysR family regulator